MNEQLHRIDQSLGGGLPAALGSTDGLLGDIETQRRLVVRSLMDESVDSSMIEGAVTTRKRALELLRSGEDPKNKSEKMVVNNYRAMQWIKERLDQQLSVPMLLELQSIVVAGTLDDPTGKGRLRVESDNIAVIDKRTGEDVYVPPPAAQLASRLKALCEFANKPHSGEEFLHPIVKACVLHFMIGYEHPFVDGNGRTARAVFYWAALKAGYRIFEFLVVSELILKTFAQYPQAYVDSEDDGGDLTYFVAYKLGVIERSIDRFREHLAKESIRIQRALQTVKRFRNLNLRQRLLLEHALRHPADTYSPRSYAATNQVTIPTARADLEKLRRSRLLSTFKIGKAIHYTAAPNLAKRFGEPNDKAP